MSSTGIESGYDPTMDVVTFPGDPTFEDLIPAEPDEFSSVVESFNLSLLSDAHLDPADGAPEFPMLSYEDEHQLASPLMVPTAEYGASSEETVLITGDQSMPETPAAADELASDVVSIFDLDASPAAEDFQADVSYLAKKGS